MATFLTKPVTREVHSNGQDYIVTCLHTGVMIREKGKRTTFGPVPWSLIFLKGAQMEATASVGRVSDSARGPRKRGVRVSRGLLSMGR